MKKGETLSDTIKCLECYCDAIVLRHPVTGSAAEAATAASVPILNAGDGVGEHPTQALLDLYTIESEKGSLAGLTVTMVGDLKNGRTVHSLARVLVHFGVRMIFVAPGVSKERRRGGEEEIEGERRTTSMVVSIDVVCADSDPATAGGRARGVGGGGRDVCGGGESGRACQRGLGRLGARRLRRAVRDARAKGAIRGPGGVRARAGFLRYQQGHARAGTNDSSSRKVEEKKGGRREEGGEKRR